jgi:CRISPR-associated endonuclease/helicase Cas3
MKHSNTINDFFVSLTRNNPYPFQQRVSDKLLSGVNLFLCAPTGAGKTWAALLPFLWAKKQNMDFADRMIYVLPLRALATTLYVDTLERCRDIFSVRTKPDERSGEKDEIVITIQTGEQKDDPFFEGDIIFTTVDQCLSSYLNMPVSLPPSRLGNINAGALIGSLIVFDEFHLLEPDKSMGTAIEMLHRLKVFSQFLIMTATLSGKCMNLLREILDGEIIKLSADEVMKLPSHKEKKRTYHWISRPMNVDDILNHHNGKRTIVIINTVNRAQSIFSELRNLTKGTETTVLLLHSRFYPEHRKETENKLKGLFGKDATKTNVILVTTQVVEAGMDISADNLHTELAPFNSIVQRGGRCARYEGKRGIGTVWIYELQLNKKGISDTKPYEALMISATRSAIERLPHEGMRLNFNDEIALLEEVHSEKEFLSIEPYKNLHVRRNLVHQAMDGLNDSAVRELIRDVSSVNVIISNNPHSLDFNNKKWPRMLSVPRSSLYRLDKFFEESGGFEKTIAWYPDEPNIIDDEDALFEWRSITSKDDFKNVSWLIMINPAYASYSSELGLQIGVPGEYQETEYFDRPPVLRYNISFETYREHIQRTIVACKSMNQSYKSSSMKLSRYYNCESEFIETLVELACALHDVGKLTLTWQERARKWQQFKDAHKLTDEPMAHSDYDPETDFEEKKRMPKQPPHSAEGAYAIAKWLRNFIGENFAAVLWTAIARHHGAFTESLGDFRLIETASEWVMKTLPSVPAEKIDLSDRPDNLIRGMFKDDLLLLSKNQDDEKLWPLYAFLVRRLRLADQKSQRGGVI